MILGIDDSGAVPTSLTGGTAARSTVFTVRVSLHANNAADGILASTDVAVAGSALFTSLEALFPGANLDQSVTIAANSLTHGVSLVGFYGQALGRFGAGQSLRTDLPLE